MPRDFASDTPPPRIIGSECEYDVQFEHGTKRHHSELLAQFLNAKNAVSAGLTSAALALGADMVGAATNETEQEKLTNYHLFNGGKFYDDISKFAEYASPESLGPKEAMLTDFAGVFALRALAAAAAQNGSAIKGIYRRSGYGVDLYKASDTVGYHENYMVPLDIYSNKYFNPIFLGFLATRHVWAGGGYWDHDNYATNQKAVGIGVIRGGSMTNEGSKPFYSTKPDEVGPNWSRLEVRLADPLQSPTIRYINFAVTSLALRLIEIGFSTRKLAEAGYPDNVAMLRASSVKPRSARTTVSGKQRSAIDFQYELLDSLKKLAARVELPKDERAAIPLFERKLNAAEDYILHGDSSAATEVEWVAKEQFINRATLKDGSEERAVEVDMLWDRVDVDGIGTRWWQKHSDDDVRYLQQAQHFVRHAPTTTRALPRGNFVAKHAAHGMANVRWDSASCNCDTPEKITMSDPYEAAA